MSRGRSVRSGWGGLCTVLGLVWLAACGADAPVTLPEAGAADAAAVELTPASTVASTSTTATSTTSTTSTTVPPPRSEPSPACASGASLEAGVHVRPWHGVDRQVIVRLPTEAPTAPPPVVFNLHGSAASAATHEAFLHFSGPAAERGYVVLTPEGMPPEEGGIQVWELFPGIYPDDPGYLASLVDWIGEAMCVDLSRVHATGFSNGSTMTNVLACHTGGRFRAIGAVAAHRFPVVCPSGPVSVLGIHGTADQIVPYLGGPLLRRPEIWMPPVEETFEAWARVGRCDPAPRYEMLDADVVRRRWVDCAPGIEVVLYTVEGGGHAWPWSGDPLNPAPVDATTLILDFFDAT